MGTSISSFWAAAQTSVPFGTLTGRPSIVRLTSSSCSAISYVFQSVSERASSPCADCLVYLDGAGADEAGVRGDVVHVFVVEELDATGDAHGGGIAQRTEALTEHVVADVVQERNIALFAMTCFEPLQ